MRSIRNDILAACIALIALISQMFFGVVHATSLWIAAAGPVAQVEAGTTAHNFLQICSAGGLVTLAGEEDGSDKYDPSRCPLCSSAASAPMLDGEQPALLPSSQTWDRVVYIPQKRADILKPAKPTFARGPPIFS